MNEIEILKVCEHKNVIQLIDYFEDHENFYLILDFLNGNDLFNSVRI